MTGGAFDFSPLTIATDALDCEYHLVPWDAAVFGFPVGQISRIEVRSEAEAAAAFRQFAQWRDAEHVRLVTCRLDHRRLRESMFLERHGYRFIEMVYSPVLERVGEADHGDQGIRLTDAGPEDLDRILEIAGEAFSTGRYLLDPRLDARFSHERYASWVRACAGSPSHRLIKAAEGEALVGFFLVEARPDRTAYWHLTAIAPGFQGRGIGRRVWRAMIMLHKASGTRRIESTISAHNPGVIGLYAGTGFRLAQPRTTLHWLASDSAHDVA